MISVSALPVRRRASDPVCRRVPLLARKQCRNRRAASFGLRASRPGFTLTELLIVITIIGMLASMTLGALYSARQSARVAKTQATITKLDRIVQAKYDEFMSRRLPIVSRRVPPRVMAELKLQVLREIMRMEMPDRLTDVTYPRVDSSAGGNRSLGDINASFQVTVGGFTETLRRPALNRRYFRKVYDMRPSSPDGTLLMTDEYSTAELLYLIVAADSDDRAQFADNEVGDNDGDGCFEFVDGWGRPILFLRWAPGFNSEIQTQDVENDHDPFDPAKIDPLAYRLTPLIYSSGPDGKPGINIDGTWVFQFVTGQPPGRVYDHVNTDGLKIGEPIKDPNHEEYNTHYDNITNHSLGMN